MDQSQQSKTLWLGDLETYMDEPYLNSMISGLGYAQSILSIKVIKDKTTGTPAKYGFIEFTSHLVAEKFLSEFNGKLIPNVANKHFKLKWGSFGGGVKPSNMNMSSSPGETSVYVGDLDPSATEAKLFQFFKNKYPSVFSAKIISDNTTKLSKGYGFVKFTNQDEAQKAISQNNGINFQGKAIKVSHAYMKTKEERGEEQQENTTESGQMIKVYQQFYSMMNDPILKATYEKQLEKSVVGEQVAKKSFKQRLESIRTLPYSQTKASESYVESLPKVVSFMSRKDIESRIFTS